LPGRLPPIQFLTAPDRAGLLGGASGSTRQPPVSPVKQADGQWQSPFRGYLIPSVSERIKVIADFLEIGIGNNPLLGFEDEQIDKCRLSSFDL
jgi:hypothetical protein